MAHIKLIDDTYEREQKEKQAKNIKGSRYATKTNKDLVAEYEQSQGSADTGKDDTQAGG
jgi:hypothetical protein